MVVCIAVAIAMNEGLLLLASKVWTRACKSAWSTSRDILPRTWDNIVFMDCRKSGSGGRLLRTTLNWVLLVDRWLCVLCAHVSGCTNVSQSL